MFSVCICIVKRTAGATRSKSVCYSTAGAAPVNVAYVLCNKSDRALCTAGAAPVDMSYIINLSVTVQLEQRLWICPM